MSLETMEGYVIPQLHSPGRHDTLGSVIEELS